MLQKALINAVLAEVYIVALVLLIQYGVVVADREGTIVVPIMMLSLFVLSAAVMGYLFVFEPARLFVEGDKKQAVHLFLSTVTSFAVMTGIVFVFLALPASAASVLDDTVIGLDAGHGGGETGAIGECEGVLVAEADVNLAVRSELAKLIENNSTGSAYLIAQLSTRKERVADAEEAGSDVLISIHHNGSSDVAVDYTQSFVTQKNDKEFARPIHALLVSVFGPDKGIKNDGYGMTVYGSLPGVLTESYFVTHTDNACDFLDYLADPTDTTTIVHQEAQAMYAGLIEYFSGTDNGGGDDGGGKPDKCSPWPSCRNT